MSKDIDYSDIRNELRTGDIVLFSGNGVVSNFIKLFSNSKWSHVGIVVKIEEMDMVLIWESTSISPTKTAFDRVLKSGVQSVIFSDRVADYDGDVAVRTLNNELSPDMQRVLADLRQELKNRPYETDRGQLAKALVDVVSKTDNQEDLSSVFCSELVAEALQRVGVLSNDEPANEFTPRDFAPGGKVDKSLQSPYNYSPLIRIK